MLQKSPISSKLYEQMVGDVANLINDIASQTNLLALNVTIEAVRDTLAMVEPIAEQSDTGCDHETRRIHLRT